MVEPVRLKLLMLHGWTQCASSFAFRCKAFERRLQDCATLTFLDAPHVLSSDASLPDTSRAWFSRNSQTGEYVGWNDSRRMIAACWERDGPFDAICGFSQGAVALHQLLVDLSESDAEAESNTLAPLLASPPSCVILVCGFPSRHGITPTEGMENVDVLPPGAKPLHIPALHVMAENDTIVPLVAQRALYARWSNGSAQALMTDRGHSMPQRSADMTVVADFLRDHSRLRRAAATAPIA